MHVPNEQAIRLVTFEPNHPVWRGHGTLRFLAVGPKGCIIRLRPGPEVDDGLLAAITDACQKGGALAVRLLPRPKAQVVPQATKDKAVDLSMREVVHQLVTEAHAHDREELRELVDVVMSRVGL